MSLQAYPSATGGSNASSNSAVLLRRPGLFAIGLVGAGASIVLRGAGTPVFFGVMKRALRVSACALAVLSLSLWVLLGAHRGWTRTTETRWEKDPVTDLEGPVHVRKFVPGVDLLAIALFGSAVLYGVSFLARNPSSNYESHTTAHSH